ncbi:sensor histidine kinase [Promicromonospora thailandica]|uniref:histidine kinase n=1 Tax=Promicromonospora thailandica TaxID=765201 RepID=A0A9X2G491_9MICO|nr:HAMP domain-containing sensor histidine kinase [Promicromonospora thailandica]MCP2265403.1 Histidine kinase-, DNA gyrase B-, and HSP90-like ATPase [Promicromonospora thailandica]BFF16941.1 hypothetical protein GCM10025730_04620 [Promicromonospora thailandica]
MSGGDDLGVVGHELRSPLSAVIGYAQLLRVSDLSEEQRRHVEVIERNGRRMLRLVEELLVSARLAAGTFEPDRADTDLAALASGCVTDLTPAARTAGVALVPLIPDQVRLSGDPEVLALAIDSLLGAAVRRTPRGGTVTLRVEPPADGVRDGSDHRWVVVEVTDTGPPVPAGQLGGTGPVRGVALGLPVVAATVAAHGGSVAVDHPPGAGTRVTITLPVQSPTESPTE